MRLTYIKNVLDSLAQGQKTFFTRVAQSTWVLLLKLVYFSASPGVLALEHGEEDSKLERVNNPCDRVKLFRVPFVASAQADHQAVGRMLHLPSCHDHLNRNDRFGIFLLVVLRVF